MDTFTHILHDIEALGHENCMAYPNIPDSNKSAIMQGGAHQRVHLMHVTAQPTAIQSTNVTV